MSLAGSYLDIDELKARTVAPASLVDGGFIDPSGAFTDPVKIAARAAWLAFVNSRLVIETSRINARLRKRYVVPFAAPVPEIVSGWLTALVTPKLYERRGWDPSDAQAQAILGDAAKALEEITEAANSEDGLFDLPLRQDKTESGIARSVPYASSEASPYTWIDVQRDEVHR